LKHLALFVIGQSPAILTESLAACYDNPVDEIRVCTTVSGASLLRQAMFDNGGWESFRHSYPAYVNTRFNESSIFTPAKLEDIRSDDDNRMMARFILTMVRDGVDQADMVSASIAGGRKTMAYLMGFAMSLFGRAQDRLTHVLVPEAWERDRSFLVPPPSEVDRITLVDVPFVRLGSHLKPAIAKADVETIVASAQTAIDLAALQPLTLRIRKRELDYLGKRVQLAEREFTIYQFFAQQKIKYCKHPEQALCGDCRDCFLSVDQIDEKKEELLAVRVQFGGVNDAMYERFEEAWKPRRAAATNLPEPLRRISEAIEKGWGIDPRAELIKVRNVGKRNHQAYGLLADKTQIRIVRE